MPPAIPAVVTTLDAAKFRNPDSTATGEQRASVPFDRLRTLWFNTGSLCNLACATCYIESSPRNDRLVYLSLEDVRFWLDDLAARGHETEEIGFTGGEPFLNPQLIPMLRLCLDRGFRVLVLTNAMRPMMKVDEALLTLAGAPGLTFRVSLDHYSQELHETERGARSWAPSIQGLQWLVRHGFSVTVAGRLKWGEPEAAMRAGYRRLFARLGVAIDTDNTSELVLFPEMDPDDDVPEITESCWDVLGVERSAMMCASSRMVVRRKGDAHATLVPCTLLPYDPQFDMGHSLARAGETVRLNHPNCASFCVLGGGACSG